MKPQYKHSGSNLEHIQVAERVLGKKLPAGAVVHHVDCNIHNNLPTNLVICPSHAYHHLLHARMRALEACGNPNWRKCLYCKQYDALENLRQKLNGAGTGAWCHSACETSYVKNARLKRKNAA